MGYPDGSPIPGRGASDNPANRFERLHYEYDPAGDAEEQPAPGTVYYHDRTASIITYNDSPDVGFDASINVYRGCEHGCIYCYARPTHEYLGFSSGLDFESRILVKFRAPELLPKELAARGYRPQVLAMSGVTDPYQPIERQLRLTRQCLQVLANHRNPVALITKNYLVTRDIDLLRQLVDYQAVSVSISLTTLDNELRKVMEPRTSPPGKRLDTLRDLSEAGIPCGVLIAPVIPGLTDHEIPAILAAAADAGAQSAGYIMLRLPHNLKDLFAQWLEQHRPEKKSKVLNRIRSVRQGRLNETAYGRRMRGEGQFAEQVARLFEMGCRQAGLRSHGPELSTARFRVPTDQLSLFG